MDVNVQLVKETEESLEILTEVTDASVGVYPVAANGSWVFTRRGGLWGMADGFSGIPLMTVNPSFHAVLTVR